MNLSRRTLDVESCEEPADIKRLHRENAELRRANRILKGASAPFAATELDRLSR